MEAKQILFAFWLIVAVAVIATFAFKINSLKLDKEPKDVSRDIALIIDRLNTINAKAEITYLLEEGSDVKLTGKEVQFFFNDVRVESYPVVSSDKIKLEKVEGGVKIIKNE